jgi:Leucine-rich repeat (LRR) protein
MSRRQSSIRPESAESRRKSSLSLTNHQPKRPFSAKPRLLEVDEEEDHDDPLFLSDDENQPLPLHSPRHRFLQLLIKDGKCAPLPIIIRHHPDDEELNLAHRTLGDDYIIYLSAVVQDLPNLTKLNLRDNRLTDRGMGKFIHTLANQQQIQSVDISENKIDSKSAEALTHFLKRRDCTLRVLKMSNADLDDDEVAIFMDALQMNQSLLEIDLSHNKLGGTGEKSVHNKKDQTLRGGAAVAAALGTNSTLRSLDLSWNKLGLLSAVNLEEALAINGTLLVLNLAYNTMRDDGAEAIGNSLAHNHSLTSLDLSHNSIGSIGAFVIATGLKMNSFLRTVNMSGNAIGSYGGQALLHTLNYHSVDREILLFNCSFDAESSFSSTPKVNLIYPTGKKSLDLSRPRNRCTMLELFRLASVKRGCTIRNIEYQASGGQGKSSRKKLSIKLVRSQNPAPFLGQPYGTWTNSTTRERHPYTLLEGDEWMSIERELYLHDASTGKVWEIPTTGVISFDFFYAPRCATPVECLNLTGLRRLKQLLITHPKEFMSLLKLCQNLVLETYQVQDILEALEVVGKAKEKMDYLAYLLLCVRDTSNIASLFTRHVEELTQLKTLHQIMRNMFFLCTNSFSGHYSLDLDHPMDRLAGVRLMEISDHENAYLYRAMPSWASSPHHGFTSQRANRSNFRNEFYRRMAVERGCTDEFFALGLEDKLHGVLECDFVSISRPSVHAEALQDDHLEYLLASRGLLNASAAPIQNPRRRRKSRQNSTAGTVAAVSAASSSSDEANPFSLAYRRLPSLQRLTSFDEGLEESEGKESQPPPSSTPLMALPKASSLHVDPTRILGHFVVRRENRLLPLDLPISAESLHLFLLNHCSRQTQHHFKDIREEDLTTLSTELNSELAMYYVDRSLDRFIINLSVRIVSKNHDTFFELVSFIRKLADNSHEAYGHGKADEADKPTKSAFLLEVLGLTSDLTNFEIGVSHSSQVAALNPTHRKYILSDDIHILGTEIFVRLRCNDWTLEGVQDRARDVCAKLFSCIGISKSNIRVVNHRTTDTKHSEFSYSKYSLPVSTHLILQQVDVSIEGLPIDSSVLLKTYVVNTRLAGPTAEDTPGSTINAVWRWRARLSSDRGAQRLDLNTFPNEFWGFKFLHLRALIGSLWITAKQARHIVNEFPQFGFDGQPHRETAILVLWNRIVDLENFSLVLQTLPHTNHHTVCERIGWQNILNTSQIDRLFVLDLSAEDSRAMAIMLAKVAQVEPGENFIDPKFRRSLGDLFIPGWSLPTSWTIDPDKAKSWDGVPRKGQLTVSYISAGHGKAMVPSIRKYFHERYSLLAVPRDRGEDFYLADTDPKFWD